MGLGLMSCSCGSNSNRSKNETNTNIPNSFTVVFKFYMKAYKSHAGNIIPVLNIHHHGSDFDTEMYVTTTNKPSAVYRKCDGYA